MSGSTITVTRHVPVDGHRAFQAWMDPAELSRWWWPQWSDTTYEIDPRPGGRLSIMARAVGVGVEGVFLEHDPPHRFVMTWTWVDDPEEGAPADTAVDTVEVTFVPVDGGTEVTVRHTSTEHEPDGGAEQGWNDVLDRLPSSLSP